MLTLRARRGPVGSVRRSGNNVPLGRPHSRRLMSWGARAVPGDRSASSLGQDGCLDSTESPVDSLLASSEEQQQGSGGTWDAASDDGDLLLSISDVAALSSGEGEEENPYTSVDAEPRCVEHLELLVPS
mgnify:CR=1 FL=1